MVVLAEVMVVMIGQVAKTDAHVVIERAGDGDGNGDTEDRVRNR